MKKVDINSDLGESFGSYTLGMDAEVLQYVSSANIACGFHAGDPLVMRRTVEKAAQLGVVVGAPKFSGPGGIWPTVHGVLLRGDQGICPVPVGSIAGGGSSVRNESTACQEPWIAVQSGCT